LEILAAIKKDPRTRGIPVVMMTSSSEQRDLIESYQAGVNAFIQKPVNFDEFRRVIEQVGVFWLAVNRPPPAAVFELDKPAVSDGAKETKSTRHRDPAS
jgi:response regulator RpfG family c-di-GMP phosphodiesterase